MTIFSDNEIKKRMSNKELIIDGACEQVGPACYELRMGSIYYDLTEGNKRLEVSKRKTVLIKPGHRVVLITLEKISVPHNVLARVLSKGSLFSIGLTPVITYADPGFCGNLGLVTQNISDKYIELPYGESIAKIDFSLLSEKVGNPYKGQHGFQTEIWPIKHQLQKSYDQLKDDPRVESEEIESYKILPTATAVLLKSLKRKQRKVDICIIIALLVNAIVLLSISTEFFPNIIALVINLFSAAVVAGITWYSHKED